MRTRPLRLKDVITKEDRQMRLPGWGFPLVLGGAFLLSFLFDHFGKLALARPAMFSVAIISITIAMRWKLGRHVWFWITMTGFVVLHFLLIVLVPWTTKWIPVLAIIPIGVADSYAMLWVISYIKRFVEAPQAIGG